jgi:hypothetical protein
LGSVENLISFFYSLNFFHKYRIAGVASAAGVSRRRNPQERLDKHTLYDFYSATFFYFFIEYKMQDPMTFQ